MTDSLFEEDCLSRLLRYPALLAGFSGGLDSTVLLHALASRPELAGKLSAVHIHHGLSAHADAWVEHCQAVCTTLSIPLIIRHVVIEQRSNIEEHARKARYGIFASLMNAGDCLVLAHHADDQAETVLLHLLRGAGVEGLSAMPPVKQFGPGELCRPLLNYSRAFLEHYASLHQLHWIQDESNQDLVFSRNYLRHQIIPLLRARWPGVVTNLTRTARHCQQARLNLLALAELDCMEGKGNTLSVKALQELNPDRLVNVLRVWLNHNQVRQPSSQTFNRIITEVISASRDAMPCIEWDGVCVRRYRDRLYVLNENATDCPNFMNWTVFPTPVTWGNHVLHATKAYKGLHVPAGSRVSVRCRQGGELFSWHGQTKSLKKLLQEWHVLPWERDNLPLIYIEDELAAVTGFAVSDRFYGEGLMDVYEITSSRTS